MIIASDVISSRPPAKNARLLTWAGPATFSKLPTELFYPLQITKYLLYLKIIASLVEKKHCFPSLAEKNIA
jgi:hypothetical protein